MSPWAVGVVGVMLANPASGGDRRAKVNRLIWRIFTKKHGITLKQEAVDFLITKLASSEDTDMEAIEGLIEYVGSMYVRQENRKDLVDLASLQSTVDGILKSAMNQIDFEAVSFRDYVHVVNAARVSKWEYEPHSKQFSL